MIERYTNSTCVRKKGVVAGFGAARTGRPLPGGPSGMDLTR